MPTRLSARDLSLAAVLSATYVGYSTLSSYSVGFLLRGLDTLVVRSVVFVVLVALVARFGASSLAGLLSGVAIEFTTPSPVRFYILPSVLAYGITYDLYMRLHRFEKVLVRRYVVIGTVIASSVMSAIALSIFTLSGFFPERTIPIIWATRLPADVVLGMAGALIATIAAKRIVPGGRTLRT